MTYQEANQRGKVLLEEQCIEDAAVDAWLLLEFVTGMNRTRFFVDGNKEMPKAEEEQYFALIEQRKKRIPLQHLTGVQEFMGLEFQVNEHVLIPTYIPTKVIEELEEEVRLHDPFSALDGKEDGLYFYRILAKESPRYLKQGGWLYMEIGYDQSEAVEQLLAQTGFTQIHKEKDLAGLDRVVCGVYNK